MATWGDAEKNRVRNQIATFGRLDLRDAFSTFDEIATPLSKWLANKPLIFENAAVQSTTPELRIIGTWNVASIWDGMGRLPN